MKTTPLDLNIPSRWLPCDGRSLLEADFLRWTMAADDADVADDGAALRTAATALTRIQNETLERFGAYAEETLRAAATDLLVLRARARDS